MQTVCGLEGGRVKGDSNQRFGMRGQGFDADDAEENPDFFRVIRG